MSIKLNLERGQRIETHRGVILKEIELDPTQKLILIDGSQPSIKFEPPLPRYPKFTGKAESISESGIVGITGDFRVKLETMDFFGSAKPETFKTPDTNYR
jgi:hypothetical protein